MRNKIMLAVLGIACALGASAQRPNGGAALNSLVAAERAFSAASAERGAREAFLAYLAADAILFRPGPVNGREWWQARPAPPGVLTWQPIFADISEAGDLGYTTGPWEFRPNSLTDPPVAHGHYVTVWRKEADGSWKVVIDLGTSNPAPAAPFAGWQPPANRRATSQLRTGANMGAERSSLLDAERALLRDAGAQGMLEALLARMHDDARMFREGAPPFIGREAVRAALAARTGRLTWQPAAANVARSGDLGYTYGSYNLSAGRAPGRRANENGSYVRIWRKRADGRWMIALDILNPLPPPRLPPQNDD